MAQKPTVNDHLAADERFLSEAARWPSTVKPPVAKLNYSHDGMIDLIIANPGISQNKIAQKLGYSASWVSQVMCSDVFQARLTERSAEIIDPTLRASVKENIEGLFARSLEILKTKLDAPPDQIPDNLALRVYETSSRALGYGAKVEQTNIQVNGDVHLDTLANRLTGLLARKKAEANTIEVFPDAPSPSNT